jgi:hypothetical protein
MAGRMLLTLTVVIFVFGVIRSYFTQRKVRLFLAGKNDLLGSILAAVLGIFTPFCNCSAVPLFVGFVESGVPLGVTFAFLISAPMVNEIALGMLFNMFGIGVAGLYAGTGLLIAIISGVTISRLKMERHIEDWVLKIRLSNEPRADLPMTFRDRLRFGLNALGSTLKNIWPYLLAGVAVGALIHTYLPTGYLATIMGRRAWWSVPAAVLIGIPIYSNGIGIFPVVQALMEKGAALGTVLAFMMAVTGLSLPEIIVLRRVLKPRLIATFVAIVTVSILLVGLLFNAVIH